MPRVARKVAPVVMNKAYEAGEQDLGSVGTATMPVSGEAKISQDIEVVEPARISPAKIEALAFNEEKVVVVVHESTDEFAPRWVEIGVGGEKQLFWRGKETTCARKFVEGLCRAKPIGYRNEEYVDNQGNRGVRHPGRVGLMYPFAVLRDDNPKGQDWLKRLQREPV